MHIILRVRKGRALHPSPEVKTRTRNILQIEVLFFAGLCPTIGTNSLLYKYRTVVSSMIVVF